MVDISVAWNGQTNVIARIDEKIITKCSARIRDVLAQQPPSATKAVVLTGAAPGPLRFVLNQINNEGEKIFIKGHKLESLEQALMIWQACEVLIVEPHQVKFEGWIVQDVAHRKISVREMQVINHLFAQQHRVWKAMIYQIGWQINDGQYTVREIEAIAEAAEAYPELLVALDDKVKSLQRPHALWVERQKKAADAQAYKEKMKALGGEGGEKA